MLLKINQKKMKKNGQTNAESNVHNLISVGTIITGDIETNGDLRIDGELKGNIITKGKLVIGNSASIEGTIKCENADVSGKLIAKVTVNNLIQLNASSRFSGDIITKKISIEPGAIFSGTCTMTSDNEKSAQLKSKNLEKK